jgi:hypothetical protein
VSSPSTIRTRDDPIIVDERPDDDGLDDRDGRNQKSEPSLLIPHWEPGDMGIGDPGDRGDVRPLPSTIIPYLCEGITTADPFQPGKPITVFVDVRNWGGGNAASLVTVRVWWADPATSFATMDPSRLIGVTSVLVPPRGETRRSAPMPYTFQTLPPPHICLIACAHNPADPAPLTPLPGLDRHWAQHNLSYVEPDPSGLIDFTFDVGNPFQQAFDFTVEVRPVADERLRRLAHRVRADPVVAEGRMELSTKRDWNVRHSAEAQHPYSLGIRPGGQEPMHLRLRTSPPPEPGRFSAFEIVQRMRDRDHPVGGIVLIVTAPRG